MKHLKLSAFFIFLSIFIYCQDIPINTLLFQIKDYEYTLSKDGKYLAGIRYLSNGYNIVITDLSKAQIITYIPFGQIPVNNLNWISDNRITYEQFGSLNAVNIDGTEKQQLMSFIRENNWGYSLSDFIQMTELLNILEDDPDNILIQTTSLDGYPIVYKLDTFTGEKEEVVNGDDDNISEWLIDRNGKVRLGIEEDDGKKIFYKKNSEDDWETFNVTWNDNQIKLDFDGKSYLTKKVRLFDFDYDSNIYYLSSNDNLDRWAIMKYDILKNEIIDTVLMDDKYDIGNPLNFYTKLLFLDSEKKLVGVRYEREKPFVKWFNEKFQNYQDTLDTYYPGYYVDIIDWNYDATVLLVHLFSDTDPGHIMIYDSKNRKQMFYTTFSEDLVNYNLSHYQIINFEARDGYELEGYLSLPLHRGKSRVPLIVVPHGGPFVRDYWRYDPMVHYFNSKGYGLLKVNFRGSMGYGKEHLLSGIKKISTVMINDIYDAAKWTIKEELADSNNIFIYGHSYGGYAALQSVITYRDFYNAAVCVGAPSNIYEAIEHFDDIDEDFGYEFWKTTVGDPDDERQFLRNISPYYKINLIKIPVLMFHGEKDDIILAEQTEEFAEEAKDLGKNVEYKIIKNEDHSISQNRNKAYIFEKTIEFFDSNKKEGN